MSIKYKKVFFRNIIKSTNFKTPVMSWKSKVSQINVPGSRRERTGRSRDRRPAIMQT